MAENIPESAYFPHDKEQLFNTIARFDNGLRVEDVVGPENQADNFRQHSNTVLIQVLLEIICHALVKDENQREILLMKACKRLSKFKVLNDLLIMDRNNALRMTMKCNVVNLLKQIFKEVIPASELNTATVDLLKENRLSTDLNLFYDANFIELGKIGQGAGGSVYKAQNKLNKFIYAVKKISFVYKSDHNFLMVMKEANNLASLCHPNIVRYQSSWLEISEPVGAVNELPSIASSNSSSCDSVITRNAKGFVIKEIPTPPGGNTANESDLDFIEFSETAEISNNRNYGVENYGQNYADEAQDDTETDDTDDDSDEDILTSNFNLVKGVLYIQMEYCECDLSFWLIKRAETKGKDLPFQMDVSEIFTSIVKGVDHIHSKNIIHRDLKPQNIFYSQLYNTVKIGDFGLATLLDITNDNPRNLSNAGTPLYAAPEQILTKNYDTKVDIYSLGIILIELINVCSTACELSHIIDDMKAGKIVEGNSRFPNLANLASNLISQDPNQRKSAKEILDIIDKDYKIIVKEVVVNEFWEEIKERDAAIKRMQERLEILDEKARNMEAVIDQQSATLNKIV